jgi:hypothetical protein
MRIAVQDLQFVTLGCSAPLGATNLGAIEGEGIAAARGLPAEAVFGKSAFPILFG